MFRTKLIGILNITPDSFSDAGAYSDPQKAMAQMRRLIDNGAGIVDIGAESTRPGAAALDAHEEWRRLEPFLSALKGGECLPALLSLDTRHALTAARALHYNIPHNGIAWINDVSGFSDSAMIEAVRDFSCKLIIMHSLSVPADKSVVFPDSADVIAELLDFARARIGGLTSKGIDKNRLIFDPGLGFGKTAAQSWDIIRGIHRFSSLEVPILVGHSRKSFLSVDGSDRDLATLAVSRHLIKQGVGFLRVHDIAAHSELLSIMESSGDK